MKQKSLFVSLALAALLLASLACQLPSIGSRNTPVPETADPTAVAGQPVAKEGQPYLVRGSFKLTNDFVVKSYFYEHAVALLDMHGFVIRDDEWEMPVESQVLGDVDLQKDYLGGKYFLLLPLLPVGEFNDVDNNGKTDKGVQIYTVGYAPNLYGEPFAEGDDRNRGWPTYLATVKADPENKDEITGGQLIVWAPDESQQFPTDFGADGLLFTKDDPAGPIPAGYSVVDLDKKPFTVSQTAEPELSLYEPADIAKKDYSKLGMLEAFEKMFATIRKEYAFTGIPGKSPDWDSLYAELKPMVEKADASNDERAYYAAMRIFISAFRDGHASLGGDAMIQDFWGNYNNGYGFVIRELGDKRVLVTKVLEGGPAEKAGMEQGAEITKFNGQPIGEAINQVKPLFLESSDASYRYVQGVWLLRTSSGQKASVTFKNPKGKEQTKELTAYEETESLFDQLGWNGNNALLPVEAEILERDGQNIGYIRIWSNSDDLNLTIRLFERALKIFTERKISSLIIDMRNNSGGTSLGLAGFFVDKDIIQGQLQYFSDATGKFENEGDPGRVLPNENRYSFDKIVLIVGRNCYSACELESDSFSKVPGVVVVGQTPSAGVEAETARGNFVLPANIEITVPTGRFVNPDGSLFLEGQGVQPTVWVPVDEESLFSTVDLVLEAAIKAALGK